MFKILIFIFLLNITVVGTDSLKLDIVTGEKDGTYYSFGQEILNTVKDQVKINNIESKGAIDNFLGLIKNQYSGFVIVQDDVLNYIKINRRNSLKLIKKFKNDATPNDLEELIKNIKIVFPLYKEEIHILVRKDGDIDSLKELNKRKVNVGSKLGGSRLTGAIILNIAEIKSEKFHFNNKEAVEKLLKGELDAVILTGGAPLKYLASLKKEANLKLLSIQSKKLDGYYHKSTISKASYPWLDTEVKTYATSSVLITTSTATSLACAAKKRTVEEILKNLKKLKNYGHKKWEQVNPLLKVKGWKVEKCVKPIIESWIKEKSKMKDAMKDTKTP